jgi:hypothetical protein
VDTPIAETTPPQTSTPDLRSIDDALSELTNQINKITYKDLRNDLTAVLENIKEKVRGIADVNEKVEAIQKRIIEPVQLAIREQGDASKEEIRKAGDASREEIQKAGDAIREADRNSKVWGRLNLFAGFLGIIVATYFAVRSTSPGTGNGVTSQVVLPAESAGSPSVERILSHVRPTAPSTQPMDGNAFTTVHFVETLVKTNPSRARDANQCEDTVARELTSGAKDLQTRAAGAYSLMVCAGFSSHDWKNVAPFAEDWGEGNPTKAQLEDLSNALYGLAIHVYYVETLVRNGEIGDALARYKSLDTWAANPKAPRFLSPVNFEPTDGRSFVTSRIADLEALNDLGDHPRIEVYNHAGGTGAGELAKRLKDQGLINTVSKDKPWQSSYQQPQICIKRPLSPAAQSKLKDLVDSQHYARPAALLDSRTYKNSRTHRPDAGLEGWRRDPRSDVDLVILLPLR